jgi:diguanylate cyclase (GGDEF)-like protein
MDKQRQQQYRQGLGPRVDALEAALPALGRDTGAAKKIRLIAESLRASGAAHGFTDIVEAARHVVEAATPQLPEQTRALIAVLRQELAGQAGARAAILLIGEASAFMDTLRRELGTPGQEVLHASSAAEAQQLLATHEVAFMVLDVMLPDQDGRYLLEILRSQPLTASIPMVVIAPKASEDVIDRRRAPDVDGYFGKTDDPRQIAAFIHTRLRQARDTERDARRDRLTGLHTRAAFCALYDHTLALSVQAHAPLTLVLLEVDHLAGVEADYGLPAAELALQHVGQVLASSSRATDIVARWSPSQFALLFPGEEQSGGMRATEKALDLLRRRQLALPDGRKLDLTFSAGLTVLTEKVLLEKAVEQADKFLYLAKAHGGNRVVSAETTMPPRKDTVLVAARADIAAVFKKILEINGLDVVLVHPARGTTPDVQAYGHFRLIILEEGDDGESGFALLRKIRESPLCHRVPVFMLAANEQSAARALALGANDYLLKPLSPFVFITRARHLLTRGVQAAHPARNLLLLDADTAALIIAGTVLHKSGGFRIRFARTLADALGRVAEDTPDAICAACTLPGLHEPELLQQLQSALDPARTALVLTAPAAEAADAARLGRPAIRGVLTKPFNLQALAGELATLLQIKVRATAPTAEDDKAFNSELQRLLSAPPPPPANGTRR